MKHKEFAGTHTINRPNSIPWHSMEVQLLSSMRGDLPSALLASYSALCPQNVAMSVKKFMRSCHSCIWYSPQLSRKKKKKGREGGKGGRKKTLSAALLQLQRNQIFVM